MKSAMDYARQALRFAERVTDDVYALRRRFDDMKGCGKLAALREKARADAKRAYAIDGRLCAMNAARFARRARAGGWWREQYAAACLENALRTAWCAGYAGDLTNVI